MALALLHNRDQVLWRHARFYESQDTAACFATLPHEALWNGNNIDWFVILEQQRETAGMDQEFLYFRCGKYFRSSGNQQRLSHSFPVIQFKTTQTIWITTVYPMNIAAKTAWSELFL